MEHLHEQMRLKPVGDPTVDWKAAVPGSNPTSPTLPESTKTLSGSIYL
jgi:hypothetical protein